MGVLDLHFYNDPIGNKPDVLAPTLIPIQGEDGPLLVGGTSHAAPVVTAGVANIIAGINAENKVAPPNLLRQTVGETAIPVEDSSTGCFDAEAATKAVCRELGLTYELGNDFQGGML